MSDFLRKFPFLCRHGDWKVGPILIIECPHCGTIKVRPAAPDLGLTEEQKRIHQDLIESYEAYEAYKRNHS